MMKYSKKFFWKQLGIAGIAAFVACGAAESMHAQVQQLTIPTIVGGLTPGAGGSVCAASLPAFASGGLYGDGCPATQASFLTPYAATVDSLGNIYVGDYGHYEVRVIYKGGAALAAAIIAANPALTGLTLTPGNVYTLAGGRIGAMATTSPVGSTTKALYCNSAGSGPIANSSNGDNCPAAEAYIKPRTIALDKDGNVYFSSGAGSATVRVVYIGGTATGNLITLLNGNTPVPGYIYTIVTSKTNGYAGDGLLASNPAVQMYSVRDIALDSKGNIYAADGNAGGATTENNVRRIDGVTGIITTVAGASAAAGSTGDGGPATAATFNSPYSIFFDSYDNLYIGDYTNGKLRAIYAGGTLPGITNPQVGYVYTVAGGGATNVSTAALGLAVSGTVTATSLSFTTVQTAGIDSANNLYLWDGTSKLVWKINPQTAIATVVAGGSATKVANAFCTGTAGPKTVDTLGDGCPSLQAVVQAGGHFTFDNYGNMIESESTNAIVRQFSFNTQFANTQVGATPAQPMLAFQIQTANTVLTTESFGVQGGTTTDFSDAGSNTCTLGTSLALNTVCAFNVKFAPTRAGMRSGLMQLKTASATVATAFLGGTGVAPNLSIDPAAQSIIGTGFTPGGVGSDVAGNTYLADTAGNKVVQFAAGSTTPTTVMTGLSKPAQVAVDGAGNIFVADTGNNRIAKLPAGGSSVVSLGSGLSGPQGVAVDSAGNVFIADTGNNRIVEITAVGGQIALTGLMGFSGLNGPTGLWEDAANNLYVADTGNNRVLELGANATQTAINLGTTTVIPTGITVDAAGDIYIADRASLQVLEFAVGSTNAATVATGLKTPNGLAMDGNGSLYVADAGLVGEVVVNRNAAAISFPLTNLNTTNTAQINAGNTGNANLLFNGATLTSATGNTALFSITPASSGGCALATAVSAGTECALIASFTPVANGSYSELASFLTNAPNGGSATLSGTGALLVNTTTILAITAPTTSTIAYGQAVTVTATITPQTLTVTPTGTVTFFVDGRAQTPQTLPSSLTVSITLNPSVATHTVSVSYTGDTVYASGSKSLSFTVVKAATTTTLATALGSSAGNPVLTFTANVSSTTATGETGTVSFYAGTTLIGSGTVSGNTASLTTTALVYSTYSFTAVYSGDANFATSTSAAMLVSGDFIVTPVSTTLSIVQGAVATASVTLTPLFNYSGTITATCSGLPVNSVCRFAPTSTTLSGTTAQTLSILIYTNVSSTLAGIGDLGDRGGRGVQILSLLLTLCVGGVYLRLRKSAGRFMGWRSAILSLLLLCGSLSVCVGAMGCGSGAVDAGLVTPAGTQTVTVTFAGAGNVNHTQAYSFTVVSK